MHQGFHLGSSRNTPAAVLMYQNSNHQGTEIYHKRRSQEQISSGTFQFEDQHSGILGTDLQRYLGADRVQLLDGPPGFIVDGVGFLWTV